MFNELKKQKIAKAFADLKSVLDECGCFIDISEYADLRERGYDRNTIATFDTDFLPEWEEKDDDDVSKITGQVDLDCDWK